MLQQTRVAAVLDHYGRFLKKFPTIRHLAASTEASVLAEWSGLGYYRRARMLRRAAQVLKSEFAGILPTSSEELRKLPGIGRYTANAIGSIAFGEPVAVVDGNVERVLRRVFGRELAGEALWTAAQNLLDSAHPAEFNQAMMELGATVCLPGVPRCGVCPLKQFCASRDGRCEAAIGKPRRVEPRQRKSGSIFLVRRGNSVLLRQRSHLNSLMPGMWELPQSQEQPRCEPLIEVKHSITTTDWHVRVFSRHQMRKTARMQWVRIGEVSNLPLTGLTRKVLRRLKVLA